MIKGIVIHQLINSPINLTELDVVASISKIKPGKAGGSDGISGKMLELLSPVEMCIDKAIPGFVASWNCTFLMERKCDNSCTKGAFSLYCE